MAKRKPLSAAHKAAISRALKGNRNAAGTRVASYSFGYTNAEATVGTRIKRGYSYVGKGQYQRRSFKKGTPAQVRAVQKQRSAYRAKKKVATGTRVSKGGDSFASNLSGYLGYHHRKFDAW